MAETMTFAGAQALAAKIETFWAKQGRAVRTRLEAITDAENPGAPVFCVRSDMADGFPAA